MPAPPGKIERKINRKLTTRERDAEMLRLRTQGKTLRAIADEMNISNASVVSRGITRALKEITREPAEELLELELLRLDDLYTKAHGQLDGPDRLPAIDRCLRVLDRRAKYLGLDKQTTTTDNANQTALTYQIAHAAARAALNNPTLSPVDIALQVSREN